MKTSSIRLLLIAAVVVLGLGIAAQVQAQTVVKCNVPFAFSLSGQAFPGGDYTFTLDNGSGSRIVLLRSWDGSEGRFLQAGVEDESNVNDTTPQVQTLRKSLPPFQPHGRRRRHQPPVHTDPRRARDDGPRTRRGRDGHGEPVNSRLTAGSTSGLRLQV